jgi:serine/threonine protein kinase
MGKVEQFWEIIDNVISVQGKVLDSHKVLNEIGRGANGVVFLAKNILLNRDEAVKLWVPAKKGDPRDKKLQAIKEAAKLAAANSKYAVQIFSASFLGDAVVATMEYINGQSLKQFYDSTKETQLIIYLAYCYLEAIEETTNTFTRHGDPHWENVLVYADRTDKYDVRPDIKLCDFGTSHFAGLERSENRHWSIVRKTILDITKHLKHYGAGLERLERSEEMVNAILAQFASVTVADSRLDEHDIARLRAAPLRDYLEVIRMELP